LTVPLLWPTGWRRKIKRRRRRRKRIKALEKQLTWTEAKLERQLTRTEAKLEKSRRALIAAREARRSAQKETKALRSEVRRLGRFRYQSVTRGIEGWEHRWRNPEGLRVLMFATSDYSGSFSRLAEALNRYSPHSIRCVVSVPHSYGYVHDLVIPKSVLSADASVARAEESSTEPEMAIESARASEARRFAELLDEADVIHFKDEAGFLHSRNGLPADLLARAGKPTIHTQYGGWARAHEDDDDYRTYVNSFAARVCMTPDLCFEWGEWDLIPFPIDAIALPYSWTDRRRVAHSPSSPSRKATDIFLEAVSTLAVEVDVITGVSYEECLERKRQAGLFFDQAGAEDPSKLGVSTVVGWYGNSAVEAAAFGIPTMAHLSDVALRRADRAGMDLASIPVLNTPRSPDGMRDCITSYFALRAPEREALARRTRDWILETHSYPAVASRLASVYERVSNPNHLHGRGVQ
jgi:hypothetical protein